MQGHIQLGALTDTTLRDYALVDIERYQAATANPFVARISTGGTYNELDLFNDWTTQDWHTGVGHVNPEEGQSFSHAMSLFPNYLLPPLRVTASLADYACNTNVDTDHTLTDTSDFIPYSTHLYAVSFTPIENTTLGHIGVYMFCPTGNKVTIRLYSDSSEKPGTLLATRANLTSEMEGVYAHWFMADFGSTVTLTGATTYHIAVQTDVASMPASGVPPYIPSLLMESEASNVSTDGGATWTAISPTRKGFRTLVTVASTSTVNGIFANTNGTYVWFGNTVGKVISGALSTIISETTIYDVKMYGNDLYVAYGAGGYHRYATDTATDTDNEVDMATYMLVAHGGYMWRSLGASLAYSSDEVTWTPLPAWAVDDTDTITGMAGLGEDLYFATPSGLWMVALGDQILHVLSWDDAYDTNGAGMVSWENALYIPMGNGSIFRYDTSGGFLNISPNSKIDFPPELQQPVIVRLQPSNFFLFASYTGNFGNYPSLWAYNVDGWHCLVVGPRAHDGGGIGIDSNNTTLYWGLSKGLLLQTAWPGAFLSPAFNAYYYRYARDGWVEYEKFYAGHRRLEKNFPEMLLDGDQFVEDCSVYWKDATHDVWQSGENWGVVGVTRPIGEWIKIGVRLVNMERRTSESTVDGPPILRAITLKYSTNVADRWRWTLPLAIHDNQEMPDGSINPYTMEQMRAHLETMIQSTEDIQYVDVDGTSYVVKVAGAARSLDRYEYQTGDNTAVIQWVYTVSLEQVS